jgi:hypothetical protein
MTDLRLQSLRMPTIRGGGAVDARLVNDDNVVSMEEDVNGLAEGVSAGNASAEVRINSPKEDDTPDEITQDRDKNDCAQEDAIMADSGAVEAAHNGKDEGGSDSYEPPEPTIRKDADHVVLESPPFSPAPADTAPGTGRNVIADTNIQRLEDSQEPIPAQISSAARPRENTQEVEAEAVGEVNVVSLFKGSFLADWFQGRSSSTHEAVHFCPVPKPFAILSCLQISSPLPRIGPRRVEVIDIQQQDRPEQGALPL